MLAAILKRALEPSFESLMDKVDQRIEQIFQGDLHRFRIGG
jgi:hypothetical protein